jgi:hypothetical protein
MVRATGLHSPNKSYQWSMSGVRSPRTSTFITPLGLGTKKRKTKEKPPGWEALVIGQDHYWPGADPTF